MIALPRLRCCPGASGLSPQERFLAGSRFHRRFVPLRPRQSQEMLVAARFIQGSRRDGSACVLG